MLIKSDSGCGIETAHKTSLYIAARFQFRLRYSERSLEMSVRRTHSQDKMAVESLDFTVDKSDCCITKIFYRQFD